MNPDLYTKLFIIESRIQREDYTAEAKDVDEWGGADVVISSRFTPEIKKWLDDAAFVIDPGKFQQGKRVVITKYSKELSWLFYQFRDTLSNYINYMNKYEYYGCLAQFAIEYGKKTQQEDDCKSLLTYVFLRMRAHLDSWEPE